MIIGGLDIATNTGRTVCNLDIKTANGENLFRASSFRPRSKRPFDLGVGEVSPVHEGKICREFRDDMLAWIAAEHIEAIGIERPLQSNLSSTRTVLNKTPGWGAGETFTKETVGGTQFGVIFRLYGLQAVILEVCARKGIDVHWVNQKSWRSAFYGPVSPPRECKDRSKWWKEKAFEQCRILGIDVANADSAESVGVCWWLRGQLNPRWNTRAEDLFKRPA